MEGSGSETIFDSLNLKPQLFINEVLNCVDDLVDEAFEFFHQQASTLLKTEGTDRAEYLRKGVAYIQNMIQSDMDKRLTMWEKYCLRHCFGVPDGFSLPKANESSGDCSMDLDALGDTELDAQLDSLREKLTLVGKESAELNRELQSLERQSVLSNRCTGSTNEALKLYEEQLSHDMFQELVKTASEFRTKLEKVKTKRVEQTERIRTERMHLVNGDFCGINHGNGLFNAALEELEEFIADTKTM
ncbi:unnamed protein product [Ilex paraguariensis]|uniref:Protein MIS12 homolog n=1 Tax=Ilex paraguariensis TaxID=185542 RepID=A0ABC8RSA0_9AQUA